ncbi:MAG: PA14 domain-containing protein, partial [Verrucomicrobiota bacterium]
AATAFIFQSNRTKTAQGNVKRFTMIRMVATTHGLTTDLRFLEVPFRSLGGGKYELSMEGNANVLTGGYWTLWALDGNNVPSVSKIVQVTKGSKPTIDPIGSQATGEGLSVNLKIRGRDADGDTLTYAATGLPTGLSINRSSGVISGKVTKGGSYNARVTVNDGREGSATRNFVWDVITNGAAPSGGLTHAWMTKEGDGLKPQKGSVQPTLRNGAKLGTDPQRGQVFSLDGSNDYVLFRNMNVPEHQGTYSFWFKTNDANAGLMSLAKDGSVTGSFDRSIFLKGGAPQNRVWSGAQTIAGGGLKLADGKWHHVAFTHGPADGAPKAQGLEYAYFEGDWNNLPNLESTRAKSVGTVSNFTLSMAQRGDYYGVLYRGWIQIDRAGTYTFFTTSDDGTKLWINDKQIVNNDGTHAMRESSGKVNLPVGLHYIKVGYFEKTGGAGIQVRYQGPGVNKQTIPNSKLFRAGGQRLFVDGKQVAQGPKVISNFYWQDVITLGFAQEAGDRFMGGALDNFRVLDLLLYSACFNRDRMYHSSLSKTHSYSPWLLAGVAKDCA